MISILTASTYDELIPFRSILELNGVYSEIILDNVKIHQYYSAPGAKLLIDKSNYYKAQSILSSYGNTQEDAMMNIVVHRSKEELVLKGRIRKLGTIEAVEELEATFATNRLTKNEIERIFKEEKEYIIQRQKNRFDLNEFLAVLFEGQLFKYLNRNKSTKYEIENELIAEIDEDSQDDNLN